MLGLLLLKSNGDLLGRDFIEFGFKTCICQSEKSLSYLFSRFPLKTYFPALYKGHVFSCAFQVASGLPRLPQLICYHVSEHFNEAKALSIIRAFYWHFPGKLILFPQNIEIKLFFYQKMKT